MEKASFQVTPRAIIFDLGDVVFEWSSGGNTSFSTQALRQIVSSPIWFEYECGRLTQEECYGRIAQELSIEASEIAKAFSRAIDSIQPTGAMIEILKHLKENASIHVFAMSNMAKEDFAALSTKLDWSMFDQIFISGEAGMRKPDPSFFLHVLNQIAVTPAEVIFIDDKEENVLSAQALGIQSLIFSKTTVDDLQVLLDNPVSRAYNFLYQNAKELDSVTNSGVGIRDNFAQLLILETTRDQNLVQIQAGRKRTWNFFAGPATHVPGGRFPDDLDTTSLALSVLYQEEPEIAKSTLDEMARYMNTDGSFLTYFDHEKLRTDAVVTANVLACFYCFGRGHELSTTLQYLYDVLLHRAYMGGTRYYSSPDCCLGFFARLWQFASNDKAPRTQALENFGSLLRERVLERVGKEGDALDLGMRVLANIALDIDCEQDRKTLLQLQCKHGGWEGGWLYRYGSSGVQIGNRGVTTALAVKAILLSENCTRATGTKNGLIDVETWGEGK